MTVGETNQSRSAADLIARLLDLETDLADCAVDRIEALTEQLAAALQDADAAEAYAWELEQRLAKTVKVMEALNAAKVYIDDLQSHEGAEGFSASTNQAAKNYHAALAEL